MKDIQEDFSGGRLLSDYIKENDLAGYRWAASWSRILDDSDLIREDSHEINGTVIEANPYFDKPITGIQGSGLSYLDHVLPSEGQINKETETLRERGTDFFINMTYDARRRMGETDDVVIVKQIICDRVWKINSMYSLCFIMTNKDLAEELNLK